MAGPNFGDFYGRVARIERARANGYGFEAPGTLGRSYFHRPVARRRSVLGPVLFLLVCGFLLKGLMYQQIGAGIYEARVAALQGGNGIERVGGWLMQADPVTVYVSDRIGTLLKRMK